MRKLITLGIFVSGIGLFYKPIYDLLLLSYRNPLFSHAMIVPAVSLYLCWTMRRSLFSQMTYSPVFGIGLMALGGCVFLYQAYHRGYSDSIDSLFVSITCLVSWIIGGFLLVCGGKSFKKALFPLFFLVYMIPIPSIVLDPVVRFLQAGSADATQFILKLLNVPAYREGVLISLPGVTVEIAKECSGIRSALALFILSTFAGYQFLRTNSRRLLLVIMAVPVTIVKNGMRIATLAILGGYVDMAYITDSSLHSAGGKPFFIVAVLMMLPVLWVLRRSEDRAEKANKTEKRGNSPGDPCNLTKDSQLV